MDKLVDLWFTQTNGTRTKSQYSEETAIKMAKKLNIMGANPKIGYLY